MMNSKGSIWTVAGLTAILSLMGIESSQAEVYQYVSQDGVIHFTNVPTDPRYRRMVGDKAVVKTPPPQNVQETILSEARQHQLDPALVKAVIKVESDFNPDAISTAGAMGLMQLMPATATTLDVRDPFNPQENIAGGVKHLKGLLDRFDGNLTLALAAYHAGETRVQRYGHIPPIEQTHRYIQKVMAAYQAYRRKVSDGSMPSTSSGVSGWQKIYKVITTRGQVIYTNNPTPYHNADIFYTTDVK